MACLLLSVFCSPPKGKDIVGTMGNTPKLNNDSQLKIFEMVKKGMNIEEALMLATRAQGTDEPPDTTPSTMPKKSSTKAPSSTPKAVPVDKRTHYLCDFVFHFLLLFIFEVG